MSKISKIQTSYYKIPSPLYRNKKNFLRKLFQDKTRQDNFIYSPSNNTMAVIKIDWNCDREVAKGPRGHRVKQPPYMSREFTDLTSNSEI